MPSPRHVDQHLVTDKVDELQFTERKARLLSQDPNTSSASEYPSIKKVLTYIEHLISKYAKTVALYLLWIVPLSLAWWIPDSSLERWLAVLFVFRYWRLVVGICSYLNYRPFPVKVKAKYSAKDVTILIPSVEPFGVEFEATIISALATGCHKLVVVTVGEDNVGKALPLLKSMGPNIEVFGASRANKRFQVAEGLHRFVKTSLVVLADDHVFYPAGPNFLSSLIAPFEDEAIGGVACHKRVQRQYRKLFSWESLLNFISCLYLCRHNFDLAATRGVDGSMFVISGRTAAYRTSIIKNEDFTAEFLNDCWFWSGIGPLNCDDDNFITRWLVNHGWKMAFQNSKDAVMETTLGTKGGTSKLHNQLIRWVRSTWRSNSTSMLHDRVVWNAQPWGVYSIYLSSLANFALIVDFLLIWLCRGICTDTSNISCTTAMIAMSSWIIMSKVIKTIPHYKQNPKDLLLLPVAIMFGYIHSLYKFHALFTANDISWGSRPGVVI